MWVLCYGYAECRFVLGLLHFVSFVLGLLCLSVGFDFCVRDSLNLGFVSGLR